MTERTGGSESQFEALLADIQAGEDLLKTATGSDDGKIAAAAADGEAQGDDTKDGAAGGEGGGEGGGEDALTKNLTVVGADGQQSEAIDATDFLLQLRADVDTLAKAIASVTGLATGAVSLVKSLQGEVGKLSGEGRGRKAVLVMHAKPGATADLTKNLSGQDGGEGGGEDARMGKTEFLAKALSLAEEGKLHYRDVNHAETLLNRGEQPQPHVTKAVYEAAGITG